MIGIINFRIEFLNVLDWLFALSLLLKFYILNPSHSPPQIPRNHYCYYYTDNPIILIPRTNIEHSMSDITIFLNSRKLLGKSEIALNSMNAILKNQKYFRKSIS